MKRNSQPVRLLAALALSASLMGGVAASAWANSAGATVEQKLQWAQKHQERVKARLAKTAQTLAINTSQQSAWDAYAAAVQAAIPARGSKPDGDAASIARMRAERAADHAKKLATVADATAALQTVLTADQRKAFDQLASRSGHRGHHGHRRHGDAHGDKKQ